MSTLSHINCKMNEIVDAANDEALDESIQVGSTVSLVIRLRQFNSMDTMLSTCTAHSGDDFYDLTNFRGCTADPEILPNFKAFFNSRTGVKRLKSTFPMFKFPDENKVIIRCTVVVCNKNPSKNLREHLQQFKCMKLHQKLPRQGNVSFLANKVLGVQGHEELGKSIELYLHLSFLHR